ncbi:MAG TPA: hypothetical protein GX717_07285, partial [Clostridiaceae bacterium]|nr:hypothetical protein [Clostridiaceae bacterium]
GGDEVWELYTYDVKTGETSFLAEDEWGFYGFDLSPDHVFYTLCINYENMVKIPETYVAITVPDGQIEQLEEWTDRCTRELQTLDPNINTEWTYADGCSWYEAYCTGEDQMFALERTHINVKQERMSSRLSIFDTESGEANVIAHVPDGPLVPVRVGRSGFAFGNYWYENGEWYGVDADNYGVAAGQGKRHIVGRRSANDAGWIALFW